MAHAPGLVATLREYLQRYLGEFDGQIGAGVPVMEAARKHVKAIDGLLSSLLPATKATLLQSNRWVDCTLAAVGSYGRGVLAPHSDLDVRIVVERAEGHAQDVAEALLYPLWDAGCQVGHQVMDIEGALALARSDLATATSLLDLRVVAGDRARVDRLLSRALDGFFTAELSSFLERLRDERAGRHEKFGGSLYLLEPDVKSGAGGLRDLDLARWSARARYHVRELDELVRLGVLLPRELEELNTAQGWLWNVRGRLHRRAGRRSDRLTFDAQEELGRALGYGTEDEPQAVAAERFMQHYYGNARTLSRMVERVLDLCTPPRPRPRRVPREVLAPGVVTFDGLVTLEQPARLPTDPALAIRLYHAAMRHDLPVYPFARDAIGSALREPGFGEALRASPEAATLFLECVTHAADRTKRTATGVRSSGSILSEMHDVGLLLALLPEFAPVVGRIHHDIYHVYTVDVHSVAAVDRLRTLTRGELASEHPLACRVASEVARPIPLYVATLLHDVGKGAGGAGHAQRGADMSGAICERLGLSLEDREEVRWLIAEHLELYRLATRRDLDDPSTVGQFAEKILESGGSPVERLLHLYLLTIADISTTSPTAMNSWKARMLDDLYLATLEYLTARDDRELARDQIIARVREDAHDAWRKNDRWEPADLERYIAGMPQDYLLGQTGESVAAHADVVLRRGSAPAILDVVPSRHADAIEFCICAADRPGLLSCFAAALAANRFDIMTARIYVRTVPNTDCREAVDFFCVRRTMREGPEAIMPPSKRELEQLQNDLIGVVTATTDPLALLSSRRGRSPTIRERPSPAVLTDVELDDRASRQFTVVDVYAKDRPGLLFTLAHALHELGLNIARSKIATEGARAADSFYVSDIDGGKVASGARREDIKRALTSAVERLARDGIL